MRRQLPEKAPGELIAWTRENYPAELGGDWLVFVGEQIEAEPDMEQILTGNSLRRRKTWAARCMCTACEDEFITQKVPGMDAIRLGVYEDGTPIPLMPGEWTEVVEDAFSGEALVCPICMEMVTAISAKSIRGGRTKRLLVRTVQDVAGFAAVMDWMVCRTVDENGLSLTWAEPMDAYVLTERGNLACYTHVRRNSFGSYCQLEQWQTVYRNEDKILSRYPDWGSINNRKVGAVLYDILPELVGTTAEKTGLEGYVAAGGTDITGYLKLWKKRRNVENLIKAGQGRLVVEILRTAGRYCYSAEAEMAKYVNLAEAKPHRMLGITKEEFREIRRRNIHLQAEDLRLFQRYAGLGGKCDMVQFLHWGAEFGTGGIKAALDVMEKTPGRDLPAIAAYMEKQGLQPFEIQLLVDTRRFAEKVNAPCTLTAEELWPRNLMAAHERMNRILEERRQMENAEKKALQDQKFLEVISRYGDLQWNDGELCILLPRSAQDLHNEGKVLRHCVGGYTDRHISGSDTIFFVRHYRRPERCYYTLDIRLNGDVPKEVQLHGYGNERHGENKQYSHRIPKKVRTFVDRWKEQILIPWWVKEMESKKEDISV